MPLIVQYSREEDDELREYCLQAFEAFVHRCPKEITPHISTVSDAAALVTRENRNESYGKEDNM